MKSAKNGSSKNYRVEGNKRAVQSAISGTIQNAIFAKVLAKMGDARMRIFYEENNRGYEGIGKIRGLLRKRGQVPITTNDIVVVTPRDFENSKRNFDIIAVLSMKEANDLRKQKVIPDYFTQESENIEFDYSDKFEVEDSPNPLINSEKKETSLSMKELNEIIDNI